MSLVLVDTSVWIDFFNGRDNHEASQLWKLLEEGRGVCICPTVIQEVLQGISTSEDFDTVKTHLLRQIMLKCDPLESALEAAKIYQLLRRAGVTIRQSNDCLIAYHALYYDADILHRDRDYTRMADRIGLRIARG